MTPGLRGGLSALLALAATACRADRPVGPAPDRHPPSVRVVSPTDSAYDLDGDSLVDLELQWADSGGAVRAAAVRVRALTGVSAPGGDTANLLDHWRLERRDATGLLAHETLDYLLHGGVNRLEVTVPDTAGNVTVDTVTFKLPYAAWLKTIASGITGGLPATGVALCSDDHRFYMPVGGDLVIVDADSLRLVEVVSPGWTNQLWQPLCVPGDPVLYFTADGGLQRYDRAASQWLPNVGSFTGAGITQSRANPNLLYVGWGGGDLGMISRSADSSLGYLGPWLPGYVPGYVQLWSIAALSGDSKVYVAYYYDGVWAIDPSRNVVLDSISVGDTSYYGEVQSFALTRDDQRLYAAVTYGYPRGVHEIDTGTDRDIRSISLNPFSGIRLALSPDEKRLFVTTQDNGAQQSSNALIDIPSWRVVQLLPRPRPSGQGRYDIGVAFHPNGKYIFVTHDRDVDIYLHRP